MSKISFANKTNLYPVIDEEKQITAENINEIKESVNTLYDNTSANNSLFVQFTNSDLVNNILSINHSFDSDIVTVSIYDNTGQLFVTSEIDGVTNRNIATINFSSEVPIIGTWKAFVYSTSSVAYQDLTSEEKAILDNFSIVGDEIVSTKNLYAPQLRTNTGSLLVGRGTKLSSNSRTMEMLYSIGSRRAIIPQVEYDENGTGNLFYPELSPSSKIDLQTIKTDTSETDFSVVFNDNIPAHISKIYFYPAEVGTGYFSVRDLNTNGEELVSTTKYTVSVGEVGVEKVVILENPFLTYANNAVYISCTGCKMLGVINNSVFTPAMSIQASTWNIKTIGAPTDIVRKYVYPLVSLDEPFVRNYSSTFQLFAQIPFPEANNYKIDSIDVFVNAPYESDGYIRVTREGDSTTLFQSNSFTVNETMLSKISLPLVNQIPNTINDVILNFQATSSNGTLYLTSIVISYSLR